MSIDTTHQAPPQPWIMQKSIVSMCEQKNSHLGVKLGCVMIQVVCPFTVLFKNQKICVNRKSQKLKHFRIVMNYIFFSTFIAVPCPVVSILKL